MGTIQYSSCLHIDVAVRKNQQNMRFDVSPERQASRQETPGTSRLGALHALQPYDVLCLLRRPRPSSTVLFSVSRAGLYLRLPSSALLDSARAHMPGSHRRQELVWPGVSLIA